MMCDVKNIVDFVWSLSLFDLLFATRDGMGSYGLIFMDQRNDIRGS